MATGEQFYVNNPSSGLLHAVLVQGVVSTQYVLTFGNANYPDGAPYSSDGSVLAEANSVVALPSQILAHAHVGGAALMVDQSFFIAPYACQVTRIDYVHAVAETTAVTLRVQVTKDTGTAAPGAGTDLLTNTGGAGFDCKAVANTVQNGLLSVTLTDLQLAAGDRLGLDFTAAATELVGVTITVTLQRL
jgi:hypothetical protein